MRGSVNAAVPHSFQKLLSKTAIGGCFENLLLRQTVSTLRIRFLQPFARAAFAHPEFLCIRGGEFFANLPFKSIDRVCSFIGR